jgi:hypothetical protein
MKTKTKMASWTAASHAVFKGRRHKSQIPIGIFFLGNNIDNKYMKTNMEKFKFF